MPSQYIDAIILSSLSLLESIVVHETNKKNLNACNCVFNHTGRYIFVI